VTNIDSDTPRSSQQSVAPAPEGAVTAAPSGAVVTFGYFGNIKDNIGSRNSCSFDEFEAWLRGAIDEHTCSNHWPDTELHKKAKGTLPYFTVCTFKGTRAYKNAEEASLLVFDLDGVSDDELQAHFARLTGVRAFAYGSPSDGLKPGRCVRIVVQLDEPAPPFFFDLAIKGMAHHAEIKNDKATERVEHAFYIGRPEGTPPRAWWTFPGVPAPMHRLAEAGRKLAEAGAIQVRGQAAEDVPDDEVDNLPDAPQSSVDMFAEYLKGQPGKTHDGDPSAPRNARYLHCVRGARLGLNLRQIEEGMREHYLTKHTNCDTPEHELRKRARNAIGFVLAEREGERAAASDFLAKVASGEISADRKHVPPPTGSWIKNGAACFDDREPISFLIEELGIAPGPPTMVVALGYVGKSLILLSLLLSVAANQLVWGLFRVARPGRAIFLDYEGPDVLLQERMQRLAVGMGLGRDVTAKIDHGRPPVYLDGVREQVRAWLVETLTGYTAAVIDSYRVACPTLDENDSRAGIPLDLLSEVSEITGCVIFVIHHASKGSKDADDAVNPRGSTALFNACGTVLTLSSDDPEGPKRVQHTKAKFARRPQRPFMIRIEDLPRDREHNLEPVRVVAVDKEKHEARELSMHEARILETLRAATAPFLAVGTTKADSAAGQLMRACKMGSAAFEPAFQALKDRSARFPMLEGLADQGRGLARSIVYRPAAAPTTAQREQLQNAP